MFRAAERLSELQRIELELRHSAERDTDDDLERRRRREPCADRQSRRELALDATCGPAERTELVLDGVDVALPLQRRVLRRETNVRRRLAAQGDPRLDRDGQDEASDEVGVLADEVDAAG